MPAAASHTRPARLSTPKRLLIALAVLVAVAGASWWALRDVAPEQAYRTAQVDRGNVRVAIAATGSLKALSTVDIGSQVSGQVLEVRVDFNDRVERGQVIARLDPANFQARVTQTEADLASARASLEEAMANLRNAEADYARKQELAERQLVARSEVDLALAQRDAARARVGSARAAIQQREAAVANARLDLDYTVIRSPVDGVVLLRQVEPGQTVAASFQTPVLFQIAEDLAQMQIELTVDESDVGQIREGQPVRFTVDAFRGRDFNGSVRQVRLSATNNQNVITYPVVVTVDNRDLSLLPGMTANAEIEVSSRENVLRVPNAALRFRPPDAPVETNGGRQGMGPGGGSEIPAIAEGLGLSPAQREAFDTDMATMRERSAQARAQMQAGGGAGGRPAGAVMVMGGGGAAPSPEAIRQMVMRRMQENFAGFRATLDDVQRSRFDEELGALFSGRRVTLWTLQNGRPAAVNVRAGISDGSHTEILGEGLGEGTAVVIGAERR